MANPLSNEQALYDKIRDENIKVPLVIWDLMYRYLGDEITAISQIALSYWKSNEPIPVGDAGKIKEHTKKINGTVRKILHDGNTTLHPVIHELFFHYIGNDVYGIELIVGFHLDPVEESPIPGEEARKILNKTFSMKQFMDRLREATQQEVTIVREGSL